MPNLQPMPFGHPIKRGKARDDGKGRGCLQAAAIDPKPPHWPA